MLARAHTFTIDGLRAWHVIVEVDVRPGLPAFAIVGLADPAVREARERVRAAIVNCGYEFPARRITANLAPADVPKAGPGLDLALACAVLGASGQLAPERLGRHALYGELGLDGAVRPVRGSLAAALATGSAGLEALALAGEGALEARLVDGITVLAVDRLTSAVRVLRGGAPDPLPPVTRPEAGTVPRDRGLDLADVRGQHHAVDAIVIAAAGAHNCLLSGAPGTGKTMLAQRMPSILPPLGREEAVEVLRVRSLLGGPIGRLSRQRPFRAPHHSITAAGLIGGARRGWIGEVALAHNGVLFLDELSEFPRPTLEALRQPLEDGRVAIARAQHSVVYPARFMLLAATNPCPCGYAGEAERCRCSQADMARHRRRLSGPLLDRIDLLVGVHRQAPHDPSKPTTSSRLARERVLLARERQARRMRGDAAIANAHMDARLLGRFARLDEKGAEMLRRAREQGLLSARGEHRVLRVARTIADLDASERIRARDIGGALALRTDVAVAPNRAA